MKKVAFTATPSATFTRPNNTTAYATGQVLSNSTSAPSVMQFACSRGNGSGGVIRGVQVIDLANQATKPTLELWLFSAAPAAENDGAAFAPSNAEAANVVAVIAFPTVFVGKAGSGAAGNSIQISGALAIPFNCAYNDNNLYGILVVRSAYTPIAQESFTVTLQIDEN